MFQNFNRRRFFVASVFLTTLATAAFATSEREVIGFNGNGTVIPGQNLSAQVTDNEAGMSVTFTSVPAGLVSYTTTISGTSATVSLPTNGNANPISYYVVATPTGGGVSKSFPVVAQSL